MMNITVVGDGLSETSVRNIQSKADELVIIEKCTLSQIQKKLGDKYKVSVSVLALNEKEVTLKCRPC